MTVQGVAADVHQEHFSSHKPAACFKKGLSLRERTELERRAELESMRFKPQLASQPGAGHRNHVSENDASELRKYPHATS